MHQIARSPRSQSLPDLAPSQPPPHPPYPYQALGPTDPASASLPRMRAPGQRICDPSWHLCYVSISLTDRSSEF